MEQANRVSIVHQTRVHWFCVAVLCCIVLHTYGEDKKYAAMKIIIATQNGAVSGTTATILVASNFSRVLPVHFFVVQNCVAVVLLRSILCCRTFHLGSVLVLPSPVMSWRLIFSLVVSPPPIHILSFSTE